MQAIDYPAGQEYKRIRLSGPTLEEEKMDHPAVHEFKVELKDYSFGEDVKTSCNFK